MGDFTVTLSPSAVLFPSPGVTDFLAGQITLASPLQVSVDPQSGVGNTDWFVCVRSPDATLGGTAKPLGDLQFFNAQTGSWVPLTTAPARLATFRGPQPRIISVPIRMLLSWETDTPGVYGPTSLVFEFAR